MEDLYLYTLLFLYLSRGSDAIRDLFRGVLVTVAFFFLGYFGAMFATALICAHETNELKIPASV